MKRILLAALILFSFTGCFLKSVHPLVAEDDAVLLNNLEGTWLDGDELWTFVHNTANVSNYDFSVLDENYEMDIVDSVKISNEYQFSDTVEGNLYLVLYQDLDSPEEEISLLIGSVGKIGNDFYLDLTPFSLEGESLMMDHYFPIHTFSRISVEGESLNIEFFQSDWIKDLIESNRVRIKHEKTEDEILITASTRELQKFVEKYAADEKAFDEPLTLTRSYAQFK